MVGVGGLMSAIGSYGAAKTQKVNLQLQADLADINARMMESSAQSALMQGQRQYGSIMMKGAQVKGAQKAATAANGIDLSSDTAVRNFASTDFMAESDANTAEANAVRAAWGYRMEATNEQNQAIVERASAAGINPTRAAMGSLLTTAGTVAANWKR